MCNDWDYECKECCTEGMALLHSLLTIASNCLFNNKAKNLENTTPCHKVTKNIKLSSKYYCLPFVHYSD